MAPDALKPDDPRMTRRFIQIPETDITYHCMIARPPGAPTHTVLLMHGWPDIGMGWRFQVPYLVSLNLQVIVPDMLGYGRTSAPQAVEEYSFKRMSGHMAAIIQEIVPGEKVILGGHDWGGYMAWRLAMWHPELFHCVFSLAVHYTPPNREEVDLDSLVKRLPTLRYQQQLAGPDLERTVDSSEENLRHFLNAIYHGDGPVRSPDEIWSNQGLNIDNLSRVGPSPMMSKQMMDYYVQEFKRNGLHGPLNWYRTRSFNFRDELAFTHGSKPYTFKMPAMLVMAKHDIALPPELAQKQQRYFEGGLYQDMLDCSHWVMIEQPEETNRHIGEFLRNVMGIDTVKGKL